MESCQNLKVHINRLKGQLDALSRRLESETSCDDLVHLTLSAAKSFDSLKAKLVEGYLKQKMLKKGTEASDKELKTLLKLLKS